MTMTPLPRRAETMREANDLYNVVAVNIETGEERTLAENRTERSAEAIVAMAIMRRGLDEEFYKAVPVSLPTTGGLRR